LKQHRSSNINPKDPQIEELVFNDSKEACNRLKMNN
jgi:hypothetical protein